MNGDSLNARLRALAAADAEKRAPEHIEAALLAAFRAHAPHARPKWRAGWRLAWAAAGAGVVAAVVFFAATRPAPHTPALAPPAVAKAPAPAAPPVVAATSTAPRRRTRPAARPARHTPTPEPRHETEEFIPLLPADALGFDDVDRVVRVRMPRAALVSFGLPVNEERATERVSADVLLGTDGSARGIRLVSAQAGR